MSYKAKTNIFVDKRYHAGDVISDEVYEALPPIAKTRFTKIISNVTSQPPSPSAAPQTLKADDEHPSASGVSSAAVEETEVVTDNPDRQYMNKKKKKK